MLYRNIVHIIQYNMVRPETIYTQTSKKRFGGLDFIYTPQNNGSRSMYKMLQKCNECNNYPACADLPYTNYMKTYFALFEI